MTFLTKHGSNDYAKLTKLTFLTKPCFSKTTVLAKFRVFITKESPLFY